MNHRANNPRYRFDNTPPAPPAGETREQRVARILKTMPKDVERDPTLIPKFLARAIARDEAAELVSPFHVD